MVCIDDFPPLLLQAPGFRKICTVKMEAQRLHQAMLMACYQWMQKKEDLGTSQEFEI